MERIEYNEVMKATGIVLRQLYTVTFKFSDTYYAIVEGPIPLEVANIIYKKYPGNPYGIRINGGCDDWNPNEILPRYYHIDSKEGLVIFITELKDYYLRKAKMPETEVDKYNDLMVRINSKILNNVDLSITTYEWMQADKENYEAFSKTVEANEKTNFGKQLRIAIDKFDKTINPFSNKDIELDEIKNYLQNVSITVDSYDHVDDDGMIRENCCRVYITDLSSGNKACFSRNPDGFSYILHYTLGENKLVVSHQYCRDSGKKNSNSEKIGIDYFGTDVLQKIDIRYNLTKGIAGPTYGEKAPITSEQATFVYEELLKAIRLASSITLDNMKKEANKECKRKTY